MEIAVYTIDWAFSPETFLGQLFFPWRDQTVLFPSPEAVYGSWSCRYFIYYKGKQRRWTVQLNSSALGWTEFRCILSFVQDPCVNKPISILFIVLTASLCHGLNQVEDRRLRDSMCGSASLCTWRPTRRPATKRPWSNPSLKVTKALARAWPFQMPAPRPFTMWRKRTTPLRLATALPAALPW